jgi:hypothetical protein
MPGLFPLRERNDRSNIHIYIYTASIGRIDLLKKDGRIWDRALNFFFSFETWRDV